MSEIQQYNEKIKRINAYDQEFWYGRELAKTIEYLKWGNFKRIVEKSKVACENSDYDVSDYFVDVCKIVKSGSEKSIDYIMLSKYACYIIVQNADARKNNCFR